MMVTKLKFLYKSLEPCETVVFMHKRQTTRRMIYHSKQWFIKHVGIYKVRVNTEPTLSANQHQLILVFVVQTIEQLIK